MEIQPAKKVHSAFKEFLRKTKEFVSFREKYKFIPGFQISLSELRNPKEDDKLLESMEEYINLISYETKDNTLQLKKQSLINERPKLHVKRSEIDINYVVSQQFNSPHIDKNFENDSPSPRSGHKHYLSPELSHSGIKENTEFASPKKSVSMTFEDTLRFGFRGFVFLESKPAGNVLSDYQTKHEDITEHETEDSHEKSGDSLLNEWTLTPAFKKLLVMEEEETKLFDSFKNCYSSDYDENFARSFVKTKSAPVYYELKEIGLVLTECQNYANDNENSKEIKMDDFKAEIFDNFKNLYSKDFKINFVK